MPADDDVRAHYDAVAGGYHEQYQRDQLRSLSEYPANYFRLQILVNRLGGTGIKRLYEVGVGEGTPLVTLARMGVEVAGCDISNAMVTATQLRLSEAGLSPASVQWADIEDSVTFANQMVDGPFDAVIAAGVLPHVRNDSLFLKNVSMLVAPGGRCFIEFRNKLFSLFTFNRHTKQFILEDLLGHVDPEIRQKVGSDLDQRLATDLPRRRETTGTDAPGYDAILSKFHNPFELVEDIKKAGFRNCTMHWYHYHPAPPMLEEAIGPLFREAGIRMEHDPSDWRGYFLCSAGLIEAERA